MALMPARSKTRPRARTYLPTYGISRACCDESGIVSEIVK
jgi:hypothetical protein